MTGDILLCGWGSFALKLMWIVNMVVL